LRWPMSRDATGSRRVYGPPQRLAPPMGQWPEGAAGNPDRGVMAFHDFNLGAIEMLLPGGRQIRLGRQADVRHCAVSPDGHWVATGSHEAGKEPGAKIWEAKTGRFVHDLPVTSYCRLAFSSDGKWLLTTGGGVRLWSVGDWHEGPSLGVSATRGAFSATGEVLALADGPGVVRLVQPSTGATLAVLTAPSSLRLNPLFFTRDGSRLVCHSDQDETLVIFDLGLIRSNLAAMGLDWEAPPCPASDGPLPAAAAVQFIAGK
jgi:WD40 repeat protein